MEKGKYITTPIYYVNDVPHIGHAYTTIAADVLARYYRICGYPVFFLTGTDEHGQKVQAAALKNGISPQEYVDKMVVRFQDLWKMLNITYDDFIRTTEGRHKKVVQAVLDILYKKGDIYQDTYDGWYCMPDERFWMEKDLIDGKCPECGRPVEHISEKNYFFRMSKYQEWLIEYIKTHPDYIRPAVRRNEVLGFLQKPLGDLCISRPRARLSWGIPLPFDEDYVTYVWFDALVNYISVPGYTVDMENFYRWWPADVHLIGKDILTTHSVYWSTILKALDIEPPRTIFAHGWWTVEGEKMSKSRGNVVDPHEVIKEFGVDPFRYFLLREVTFGMDGDFSKDALIHRINSDLANDLGNLLNRTLSMIERYFGGVIPQETDEETSLDKDLRHMAESLYSRIELHMGKFEFHKVLQSIWELIGAGNKYIDETAPWTLAKDETRRERLKKVIYSAAEVLRIASLYIFPFMPSTAEEMWKQLGMEGELPPENLQNETRWGGLIPGKSIYKGTPLFPRIDKKLFPKGEVQAEMERNMITIDEFAKIELRTGKIINAERIEGSNKLIKLIVDTGDKHRQLVAGIGKHYRPEDLINKKVIVVTNLKPAKLMGITSEGMVLAAEDGGILSLISPDRDVSPGARVK